MNYLTLERVSKSYGDNILFSDIELHINQGQKIALIARNGTGKTSLLKIIAGEEKAEGVHAKVEFHPEIRIGYLKQEPQFDNNTTIWEAITNSNNPAIKAWNKYQAAMNSLADDDAMQEAVMLMDKHNAWDMEAKMEEILENLYLNDREKKISTLSGGQLKRLSLGQLLIDEPDFLIMDEPTNHLDLAMIEWLEEYLMKPHVTLLLITHDRYFLDRICDTIVELENGDLRKFSGNYSEYLEKKSIMAEIDSVTHEKSLKLLKKEKEWASRMPKARTTKNKARIDKFHELKEELYGHKTEDEMMIELRPERLGSKIIELQYISKSFDNRLLVDEFHYKFQKKDKIGIIGPNGAGKSTLVNMMTGLLSPDSGKVVIGETVKFGYYKQEGISLAEEKRVIDVIQDIAEFIPLEKGRKITAKQLLEMFLFDGPKQQVYVRKLSGGEKRRLFLLTVLMKNPNVLILDEPTNDLDILTLNVLEQYLIDFPGVVIVVSHDRYFMDKIVDHLFVLEGNGVVRDFPGNYSQYRDKYGSLELDKSSKVTASSPDEPVTEKKDEKPAEKELSYEDRKQLGRIESKLKKLEKKKGEIEASFADAATLELEELQKRTQEIEAIKSEIEELEMEWLEMLEG